MRDRTHDFCDGRGPVPAHRHPNGGGWVADTTSVDASAYVGERAKVYGEALVYGEARVYGNVWLRYGCEYRPLEKWSTMHDDLARQHTGSTEHARYTRALEALVRACGIPELDNEEG